MEGPRLFLFLKDIMITVRRKLRASRRWGDVQRLCDYCGVAYYRSQLRMDASGNLRCPKEGNGKDSVTLSKGNAEGAKQFSPQIPVYDSGSVDTSSNEDETTPPGILNTVAGWWQLNFAYGPGGVQNISNSVGGFGTLANGNLRQADPLLRPDSVNSFTYTAGDTMQTPLSELGDGATRTPETPDEILSDPGFWHRADVASIDVGVDLWTDGIPTPFDIAVPQATDSEQPAQFLTGGDNNQADLSFDGVNDELERINFALKSFGAFYMAMVCRVVSTPSASDDLLVVSAGLGEIRIRSTGTNFTCQVDTPTDSPATPAVAAAHGLGTWRLVELYWSGTTVSIRQDGGTPATAGLTGTMNLTSPFVTVGYMTSNSEVDVAEGIFSFVDCSTNGERAELIAYFNERYGESWT